MLYFSLMNAKFHLRCLLLLTTLIGGATGWANAQWNFLGPQWISTDSVASHAVMLNDQRQVHVASVVQGGVTVHRFDGFNWQPVGVGLPTAGIASCALAMGDADQPLLALGPALRLLALDNGFWLSVTGLPTVTQALDLQLQVALDGRRWLAWWQPGSVDSTFVLSDRGGLTWHVEGAMPGRIADMALTDDGDPLLLLAGAPALLQFDAGVWNPYPVWSHPADQYIALTMLLDGADSSAVVLRRGAADDLSVERYALGGWQPLGSQGFATGDATDLALSLTGTLHVASVHGASQGLPQVYQFVAGDWQLLGGQYVYNNTVAAPKLAFDPGAAFLLFQDGEQSLRNSVMYLGSPVGAAEAAPASALSIFPNPVASMATVRLGRPVAGGVVHIYDGWGRCIGSWEVRGLTQLELDLAAIAPGPYRLVLQVPHQPARFLPFTKIQ